jgi:hypothetical protein
MEAKSREKNKSIKIDSQLSWERERKKEASDTQSSEWRWLFHSADCNMLHHVLSSFTYAACRNGGRFHKRDSKCHMSGTCGSLLSFWKLTASLPIAKKECLIYERRTFVFVFCLFLFCTEFGAQKCLKIVTQSVSRGRRPELENIKTCQNDHPSRTCLLAPRGISLVNYNFFLSTQTRENLNACMLKYLFAHKAALKSEREKLEIWW